MRISIKYWVFAGALLLCGFCGAAEDGSSDGPDFDVPANGDESLVGEILLSMVLVGVLGWVAWWMSKRFAPKLRSMRGKHMSIVETLYLGPNKTVHLLEIGGKTLLIGSTNENIRLLEDVTEELEIDGGESEVMDAR